MANFIFNVFPNQFVEFFGEDDINLGQQILVEIAKTIVKALGTV